MNQVFELSEITKKSILWGFIDAGTVTEHLKDTLCSLQSSLIEISFKGIRSVDDSFTQSIFIKYLKNRDDSNRQRFSFILSNIEDDIIVFQLNRKFKNDNLVVLYKDKSTYRLLGNTSVLKIQLLNKFLEKNPISKDEIFKNFADPELYREELHQFINMGYIRENEEILQATFG